LEADVKRALFSLGGLVALIGGLLIMQVGVALAQVGNAPTRGVGEPRGYIPIVPTQSNRTITLTGNDMAIEEVVAIARHGAKVQLSDAARTRTNAAYELVLEAARQGVPVYGFNRASGPGRETAIFEGDPTSPANRQLLERRNLARFRNGPRAGAGPEVADEEIVRAQLAVLANMITYRAASPQLTDRLLELINHRITPVVQSRGSPGQGDLPMMENVAGTMVGAGQAYYQGRRMPAREALALAGLQPLQPTAADGSALVSTNAYSAGQAALLVHDGKALLDWSDMTFAMSMLGLNSSLTPFSKPAQDIRPFPYPNWQSRRMLNLVRGSYLFDLEPQEAPDGTNQRRIIQDPLSFRDYNHRNGAAWESWDRLRQNILIHINSSDHNPVSAVGTGPSDSWELQTPWFRQYYVGKGAGGVEGYVMSNANFVPLPWGNDLEFFTIALSQTIAASVQRSLRFDSAFFTVVTPADVLSASVRELAPVSARWWYTVADLMAELQTLANPVPAQGQPLLQQVEDMEMFTRQKVARARMAVDTSMRILAEEIGLASYWMELRKIQNPGRSFGGPATAALQALRAVIPWQSTDRPEVPQGDLIYAFMHSWPAATFMGSDAAGPTGAVGGRVVRNNTAKPLQTVRRQSQRIVRARTNKQLARVRSQRSSLKRQAAEATKNRRTAKAR
jgi:histidine ammonia-lyase